MKVKKLKSTNLALEAKSGKTLYDLLTNDENNYLTFEQRLNIFNHWNEEIQQHKKTLTLRTSETGCKKICDVHFNGESFRNMVSFVSNDYLNLSQHPRIIEATKKAIDKYGMGAGSSPLGMGRNKIHVQLEQQIAAMKGCEDAMILSSGYSANVGVIRSILGSEDVVLLDALSHSSLMDGASFEGINKFFFAHNDVNMLENMLRKADKRYINKLIVVEGVYSMDGDIAPLDKIQKLAKKYNAYLLVDDAHGLAVMGKNGHGTINHFGLNGKIDIVTGTFSKAAGSSGGYIAGKKQLINYMRIHSRSYMCSTSPSVADMAAALEALNIMNDEPKLIEKLRTNVDYLHKRLKEENLDIGNTQTAITPVIVNSENKVNKVTELLLSKNILVQPVIYPFVPQGKARIRMTVSAGHSFEELDSLVDGLKIQK